VADTYHLLVYALIAVSMLATTLGGILMRRRTKKVPPVPAVTPV
jgi:hypothetical protein